jgi:hypothetical protein
MKITPQILENELIRVTLEEFENQLSERIELKDAENLIPLLNNQKGFSTLLFYKHKQNTSRPLKLKAETPEKLVYEFSNSDLTIILEVSLKESNSLYFKYDIMSKNNANFSKIIANYGISLSKNPTNKWVPHLRPKENYVIGDHVFRSPAIIYNKDQYTFALMPDLHLLKEHRPYQTFMDFNLKSAENGDPQIAYGFGNYKADSHVFFKHNPKKMMKLKKGTTLSFAYFIKIFNGPSYSEVLAQINAFFWEIYGHHLLYENLAPQILPYEVNTEEAFKAIFERHKLWVNFTVNGVDCGGVFQNTWLGKRKRKVKFTPPEKIAKHKTKNISQIAGQESLIGKIIMHFANSAFWIKRFDWFTRHIPIIRRTAEIWFNAWFLNLRTGYAFRFFGEFWKDQDLIEKGNRILNTVMNLPRIRGVFPTVVFPASYDATEISTINGLKAFIYTDLYNIVDISLTLYWALKFYQNFDAPAELKQYAADFLDLLQEIQLENGAIPTYISFEGDNKTPIVSDILINSASSGAPLMFLTEYYKISQDERVLPIAEKIAKYINEDIIPHNKWHDFEPFFSCTHFPLDFYCDYTDSHVMNALCIYWCTEGFKELHKITENTAHLKSGEYILAVLSLFQQVWDMRPYISYNTYGGFCSQNADAELSDARQGLFVRTYMEYYLLTGKKEYMERAIATLRACWAMQLIREYEEQCPGNIERLGTLDGVDRGCVCENYGHSGHDLRIPGYIMFDWGAGTSASATAYVKQHFGDLFLDFKEKTAWGIDGIIVKEFNTKNNTLSLTIEKLPDKTTILIKSRDPPAIDLEIIINKISYGLKNEKDFEEGFSLVL